MAQLRGYRREDKQHRNVQGDFSLRTSVSAGTRNERITESVFFRSILELLPVRNPIDTKRLDDMEAMIEKMRHNDSAHVAYG